MIILIIISAIIIYLIVDSIKVVAPEENYVVERNGTYYKTWKDGVHIKIPIIDRVVNITTTKEMVKNSSPQPVITKDNIALGIRTVVSYQIIDPKLYTYGVENPPGAIDLLIITSLRKLIVKLEWSEVLATIGEINAEIHAILDEVTAQWGIKVNSFEIASFKQH